MMTIEYSEVATKQLDEIFSNQNIYDQQWWQFFSRGGTLTHEEFCLKLDKIIQDVFGDLK